MTTKTNKPVAPKSTGMNKEALGLAVFALLALVIVSVAGYTVFAADSEETVYYDDVDAKEFVVDKIKYQVLSETDKTVGVVANNYTLDIVIPESVSDGGVTYKVTTIMEHAFTGSDIAQIWIPSSVTTIEGTDAFYKCRHLESIGVDKENKVYYAYEDVLYTKDKSVLLKYPEGKERVSEYTVISDVKVIESYAFGDAKIEKIDFRNVEDIHSYAFYNNTFLDSLTTGDLKTIGSYAFSGSMLSSVVLSEKLTAIGDHAFSDCSKILNLTIESTTLENIQEYAFANCSNLSKVVIKSNSVKEIESYAFADCVKMVSIDLRQVEYLADYSLFNCRSLTELNIPSTLAMIDNTALMGCSGLKKFTVDQYNNYYKAINEVLYTKNSNELVVYPGARYTPNTVVNIDKSTTAIQPYAFSSCVNMFTLSIDDCTSITHIGEYAFYGCGADTIVTHHKLQSVGDHACEGCINLERFYLPCYNEDNFKSIGDYTFKGCVKLVRLGYLPDKPNDLCLIPATTEHISDTAFEGCASLVKFEVVDRSGIDEVYKAYDGVLYTADKTALIAYPAASTATSYTMFKETVTIPQCAFMNATNLTAINVDVNNTVFSSDDGVLFNKNKSTLLHYPAGKTGDYIVPTSVVTIGGYSFAFTKIAYLDIVNTNVETIENYAFLGCTELKSFIQGDNLKSINDYAFAGCTQLGTESKTLTIGKNVSHLGAGAFENCVSIVNLEMLSSEPVSLENEPFVGCANLVYIFVPSDSISVYRSSELYKEFKDHIYSVIKVPEPISEFTYDGTEKTSVVDEKCIITGNTATDAGTYTASVTPDKSNGYVWDMQLSTVVKTLNWEIKKCALSFDDIEYEGTKNYDGTTAVLGNPKIKFVSVPEMGAKVTYSANYNYSSKDAGVRLITATDIKLSDDSARNYTLSGTEFTAKNTFVINKAPLTIDAKEADYTNGNKFTFPHVPTQVGSEMVTVIYTTTDVNAGDYTFNAEESGFTAIYIDETRQNYEIVSAGTFTINPIEYDMTGFLFSGDKRVYNGEEQTIVPSGLPTGLDGITLEYRQVGAGGKDVGEHIIYIEFQTKSINYVVPDDRTARLTITAATMNVDEMSQTYSNVKEYTITGVHTELGDVVTLHYYNVRSADVGTYVYNTDFSLEILGSNNYKLGTVGNLTVDKADYVKEFSFDDKTVVYNGEKQSIRIDGKLPTGLDGIKLAVSYSGEYIDVGGPYTVVANYSTVSKNYNVPSSDIAQLTITPAQINLNARSADYYGDYGFVFENIPAIGKDVVTLYYFTGSQNAGVYTFEKDVEEPSESGFIVYCICKSGEEYKYNYEVASAANFTINKVDYKMDDVRFNDATYVYDAKKHSIEVTGELPIGIDGIQLEVSYTPGFTDVGEATIVASFSTASKNYITPAQMKATLKITPAPLNIDAVSEVYQNKTSYVYSDAITGISGEKITLVYYGFKSSDVGKYVWKNGDFDVTYTSSDDKYNYEIVSVKDFTVTKADYDMSGVSFVDGTFVYDGQSHMITIDGTLPMGLDNIRVTVSYTSEGLTDAGFTYVAAVFSTASKNYNVPAPMYAILTVEKFKLSIGEMSSHFNGDNVFELEYTTPLGEGLTLEYTTTYIVPATYTWKTESPGYGFIVKYTSLDEKENYEITAAGDFKITSTIITVTFDPDDGREPTEISLNYEDHGYKVDRTKLPTRSGYVNLGWYATNGQLVDFDDYFLEDGATYKAKWQQVSSDLVIDPKFSKSLDIDLTGQTTVNTIEVDFSIASVYLDVSGLSNWNVITIFVDNSVTDGDDVLKLTITSKDGWFSGYVDVSMPCDISEGYPSVYHYIGTGKVDMKGYYDEEEEVITFSTNAYDGDLYGVEYSYVPPTPTPSKDNNSMIILAAVAVLVIVAGAAAFFFVRKH